jgi:cyclic pyranopterin phosphate synthase
LRITSEGNIKPCLLKNDNLVNIIEPIRNKLNESDIEKIFLEGVNNREPYYK